MQLFERKGKRLVVFTEAGAELLVLAEWVLLGAYNIKKLASQYTDCDDGELVITATHT